MMIRPSRLHHLLLLILLLAPSWSVADVWAAGEQGSEISVGDGAPTGELLQTRPAKDPVVSVSERHAGKDLGGGAAGGAYCEVDLRNAALGWIASAARFGDAPCRPAAERLPYDATAPPTR